MKRFSILKKLSVLGATAAAVTPIILTATSCTPTSIIADAYNYKMVVDSNGETLNPYNGSKGFGSLLLGSNSAYKGNYILLVGSNMFDSTCKFFTNSNCIRERDKWFSEDYFPDSFLYNGIKEASLTPEGIINFGIYNAIDFFNGEVYDTKGHRIYVYQGKKEGIKDCIGPFDKWTDSLISQTDIFNKSPDCPGGKYDWDEESVSTDDYIRNDDYAKAYRSFCQKGLVLYPKQEEPEPDPENSSNEGREITFNTDDGNTTSLMLIFKDGILKTIDNIPFSAATFKTAIVDNFKDAEEPEPEPEPETLI